MSWTAEIMASGQTIDGVEQVSFEVRTAAASADAAKAAAALLMRIITGANTTFVRYGPEGDSYTSFETKLTSHAGYCRFTTLPDVPGETTWSQHCAGGQLSKTFPGLASADSRTDQYD